MRIHVTFASLWMTLCSCQPVQFSLYAHFSGRWVTWPEGFTMVALWMGSDKWGLFERTSNLGWNLVKWSCLSPLFSLSFTSNSDVFSCSWTWKQLQYCGKAFFPSWFLGGFWLFFLGIFITFTCFRSSILVFTFSFHFNPYTVSQGDASLDQGGNHCWPKTTRRPVSHFAKKHLEIFLWTN